MPVSAENQLERRRKILACTRDMINEVGHEKVNVRDLAQRSGVSVPTLYNQFGSKDELLYASAAEIYNLHLSRIEANTEYRGLDRLVFTIRTIEDMITTSPRIARLLVVGTSIPADNNNLRMAERFYRQPVLEMYEDGELAQWIDPEYIGRRIFTRIGAILLEWNKGDISDSELITARRTEPFIMLLGLARGEARKRIEQLLKQALPHAASKPKPDR